MPVKWYWTNHKLLATFYQRSFDITGSDNGLCNPWLLCCIMYRRQNILLALQSKRCHDLKYREDCRKIFGEVNEEVCFKQPFSVLIFPQCRCRFLKHSREMEGNDFWMWIEACAERQDIQFGMMTNQAWHHSLPISNTWPQALLDEVTDTVGDGIVFYLQCVQGLSLSVVL